MLNKIACFILFVLVISIVITSCIDTETKHDNNSRQPIIIDKKINGQSLYMAKCSTCHGTDGKLGAAGAKNLAKTKLNIDEVKQQIINGKGVMPPFSNQLSEQEIQAISDFVLTELKGK